MNKCVLLSTLPLPYNKIGSWTTMYDFLLKNDSHQIDYIICPNLDNNIEKYKNIEYYFAKPNKINRLKKLFIKYKYEKYLKFVEKLIIKNDYIVVKIIDNYLLLEELERFLISKKIRNKCRIIFFIHGFSYFLENDKNQKFFTAIDHMVFLTKESYNFELNRTHSLPCKVSILYNGIDSKKFYKLNSFDKDVIKKNLSIVDKKIFLWIANDRPKKGLHIMIEAWEKSLLFKDESCQLIIIGTNRIETKNNISFIGKIENQFLPFYYQISDYYFFTTLCHEGFPLSLTEAIKSGITCFASDISPLNEITQNGKFAYLVKNPNSFLSWKNILNKISNDSFFYQKTKDVEILNRIYDINDWVKNLNEILIEEKSRI